MDKMGTCRCGSKSKSCDLKFYITDLSGGNAAG